MNRPQRPKKVSLKPKLEMGIPPLKEGEEKTAKAGGTFDPNAYKGNV